MSVALISAFNALGELIKLVEPQELYSSVEHLVVLHANPFPNSKLQRSVKALASLQRRNSHRYTQPPSKLLP
jgi:hypothetical protein